MPKKAAKGQSLGEVTETLDLQQKRRDQYRKDYPMCSKLSKVRSDKAIIDCFLDWLDEEKNIVLCSKTGGPHDGRFAPHIEPKDKLLMAYFGIDEAELERERRKIIAAQRRANGDLDASEDD